jgi:hypothetical protein
MMEVSKLEHALTKATRELVVWAACFALSLAQWHDVVYTFGKYLQLDVQAEQGILDGYPHWRLVQARVLGPWLEKFLGLLFGLKLALAHAILAIVILTLCGVVMFHAGRAIGGRQRGWSALLAFHVLFALMMAPPYLYIYDYFVLLAGAVFMLLMIRQAPWWSFLLLMSVAFLNHEGAVFIGVWMVAKALADAWADRRRPDWRMLSGGVLGSLGGILVVEYLRTSMLKGEAGWELLGLKPPADGLEPYYFFLRLPDNLHDIIYAMVHPHSDLWFVIPLPLVLALALAIILVLRHGIKAAPLMIYAVTQVAALLLFAFISETRDLLELVPFLCLGGMLAAKPDWDHLSPCGCAGGKALAQTKLLARPAGQRVRTREPPI